jgi:hypothetical protein
MDAHRNGPEELNSTLVFFPELGDPMPPAGLMGLVCYAGPDAAAAAAAFAPLLSLGTVRMSQIDEKPYADVLEEPHPPGGRAVVGVQHARGARRRRVVDAVDRYYAGGSTERMMFIRQLGGAVNRVAPDATAFAHRNVEALVLGGLFAPEDTSDDDLLARLQPFEEFHDLGVGSYPGFVATNLPEDVERIYPLGDSRPPPRGEAGERPRQRLPQQLQHRSLRTALSGAFGRPEEHEDGEVLGDVVEPVLLAGRHEEHRPGRDVDGLVAAGEPPAPDVTT